MNRLRMEFRRRVGVMMSLLLLMIGNIATALAPSGVDNLIDKNLNCTNDLMDSMSCYLEAQNCVEHSLTLIKEGKYHREYHGTFKQCDDGRCCCFIKMPIIYGAKLTATVYKGGESIGTKVIDVKSGFKPRVPTDISVKESNGNFQVRWKTNMSDAFDQDLSACVTHKKKGDPKEVTECVTPTDVYGYKSYDIHGRHLEPSTTYVVSVKSLSSDSGLRSDSSEEVEFTTAASPQTLILAIILSLSVAAVIISVVLYGCYVKLKSRWWDIVAKCPNPKLLDMRPSEQEVLKPVLPVISSICVEPFVPDDDKPWWKGSLKDTSSGSPQQSSGISTGSSNLSYANTEPADIKACVQDALFKALANISPISPLTTNPLTGLNKDSGLFSAPYNPCGVRADNTSLGSSGFDNKSYSLLVPGLQHQISSDSSGVQMQAEMICDSAYHPSEGETVICAEQQVPACPLVNVLPVVSSVIPTDMSYQQCNGDSGRFLDEEDSSLSSVSSGTNTMGSCDAVPRVEAEYESFGAAVSGATKLNGQTDQVTVCDENPCYGCVPAGSHGFPPVDDNYQAFQSLVEQPEILLEKRSGDEEEHLSKCPEEPFTKMSQSFFSPVVPRCDNIQGGQCLSELHRPFVTLIPVDQPMPVITDSDYQSY